MPNSQKRLQRLRAKRVAKPPYHKVDDFNRIKSDQPAGVQNFIHAYAENNFIQYLPYIIAVLLVVIFAVSFLVYIIVSIFPHAQNTSDPISFKFVITYWSIVGTFILLGPISQSIGSRRWFLLFTSHREITTNEYHAIVELRKLKPAFNTLFEEQQKQKIITKKIYADLMLRYLDSEISKKRQHDRQAEIAKVEAKIQQHQNAKKCALSVPLSAENKKETS